MANAYKKHRIITIVGTRPEAIKMAPVIKGLQKYPQLFNTTVVATAQHRQMLDQVMEIFKIRPDYDLNIMQDQQTLSDTSINILRKINKIYDEVKPHLVLVQGDTLTSFIGCLAAYYDKIPIGHIEAGLRTYKKYYPFPEEIDRQLIDIVADFYFAPTKAAKQNLLNENKDKTRVFMTGNTVVDALLEVAKEDYLFSNKTLQNIDFERYKVILVETHRREIWGKPMQQIHKGLRLLAQRNKDIILIFPVHLNPVVQNSAKKYLDNHARIHLIDTLNYKDLIKLLKNIYLVVTDSGGLQEEAPTFGKPVLVTRAETERPEGIKAGIAKLTGINPDIVIKETENLIKSKKAYQKMAKVKNPYGDGQAARKIVKILKRIL